MFVPAVPLVLASPTLEYVPIERSAFGPLDALAAESANGVLIVRGQKSGKTIEIARIEGTDAEATERIRAAISRTSPASLLTDFPLTEQIERIQVTLSPSQEALRALLTDADVRLAILKAMVYGCAAPKTDVAPLSGRCSEEVRRRLDAIAVDQGSGAVSVPSLEQVVAVASSKLYGR
jgi:hypothetical protein